MIHRGNWLAVNRYLKYRSEVDRVSGSTIRLKKTWLRHLILWAGETAFFKAPKIRPTFPQYIISARLDGTGEEFSQIYLDKVISTSKRFFKWLSRNQSGFSFKRSNYLDTLRAPKIDPKPHDHEAVSINEILEIANAPTITLSEERIQAAAVLLFLSGIRIGAFVTLPIKAVEIENRSIMLWPSLGVKTKFNKHSTVFLFEIPELLEVVTAWDIKVNQSLNPDDLWFPPFTPGTRKFVSGNNDIGSYRSDGARKDLKVWLKKVNLQYHSPHKFRHGHAVYGLKRAEDFSDYKAVSQNLGHASITTTDQIYSILPDNDVKNRIAGFSNNRTAIHQKEEDEKIKKIREILNE